MSERIKKGSGSVPLDRRNRKTFCPGAKMDFRAAQSMAEKAIYCGEQDWCG